MANTDRTRKLLVRTSLVTSTTIATLVGAQSFAMLDARSFLPSEIPTSEQTAAIEPVQIAHSAPDITIIHAAPSITVLRESGQVSRPQAVAANPTVNQPAVVIQPPVPAQITAPQPIVIQRPVRQRTRSSR